MKKILLVEDTIHLSEEIGDILRLEGYSANIVNNALEGLDFLRAHTIDLIITDLLMPVMNGYEFIEQVRLIPSFKLTPIIILSAKTSVEDKTRGKEVGANAFIQKPCKAHELVTAINTLLK